MIAVKKLAAGIAALIFLAIMPAALGQNDIAAQATYLEELDSYLMTLPVTDTTTNPDGSIAKEVTFDTAGCSKRTVTNNADGTKSVLTQACSLAANNALSYQLDQNGVLIPGSKNISTTPCVPTPACVKPTPTPTPAPAPTTIVGGGSVSSAVAVVNVDTDPCHYNYCETTKMWERVC